MQKVYDKGVKSYIYTSAGAGCKLQLPKDDKACLGLLQPYLVLQVCLVQVSPPGAVRRYAGTCVTKVPLTPLLPPSPPHLYVPPPPPPPLLRPPSPPHSPSCSPLTPHPLS